MKKLYIISKQLLTAIALLIALTSSGQETLEVISGDIMINQDSTVIPAAVYTDSNGDEQTVNIKWHTEPGYLGKVDKNGSLIPNHSGEGYLIAKYKELRDSVKLVINGTKKDKDNDDGDKLDDDAYPKVKIVPGNIRVEVGDSVELYAFYIDSFDVKIDTMNFLWSVEPMTLGEFPDSENSMFFAADTPGKGTIIAQMGDLADTVKVDVYESKWKKEKKEKENNGNNGKQLSIEPEDMVVYTGEPDIQYSAILKTNGNKHQGDDFLWSVSDTTIATINESGLLTLKGETGMTLVNAERSNFGASVELLVIDSTVDMDVNTISIHRVLPNGKKLKAKIFKEGDSYKIGGLPYPLNILNGGSLHFPFGCINEDITIYMFIPEEYADMNKDSTEVIFEDNIITGVKFSVMPASSDSIVEPFNFNANAPVQLKLVYKRGLLDSLGIDPQDLDVFFADNTGFIEVDDKIAMIDTAKNRIYASIAHFSTIVVRESKSATSVKDLAPVSDDKLNIYPNPIRTSANVQFRLAKQGAVNISIYNLVGQKIKILVDEEYPEGLHEIRWQGNDMNGSPATSGIYFCRFLKDGKVSKIKKIVINR